MTREEARQQIGEMIRQTYPSGHQYGSAMTPAKWIAVRVLWDLVDQITALPFIAVVDRESQRPENPYPIKIFPMNLAECKLYIDPAHLDAVSGAYGRYFYTLGQEDMIDAGWVKEVK